MSGGLPAIITDLLDPRVPLIRQSLLYQARWVLGECRPSVNLTYPPSIAIYSRYGQTRSLARLEAAGGCPASGS